MFNAKSNWGGGDNWESRNAGVAWTQAQPIPSPEPQHQQQLREPSPWLRPAHPTAPQPTSSRPAAEAQTSAVGTLVLGPRQLSPEPGTRASSGGPGAPAPAQARGCPSPLPRPLTVGPGAGRAQGAGRRARTSVLLIQTGAPARSRWSLSSCAYQASLRPEPWRSTSGGAGEGRILAPELLAG
jgi:hypothetical protein